MDIKQLVTGDPKAGFYPITQDTITVIELNKAVMSLTNESSSEEIIAAFDNLESFQALIAEVSNPQNICSGILVNETPEDKRVGKYEATIIANIDVETLYIQWVENDRIVSLIITNTDGTMSCIRNENNVGGGSGESDVYVFETNNDIITLEEYTALENAINSNKIILYNTGELKYLFTIALVRDEVIILSTVNADINNIQISKTELKIKSETIRLVTLDQVLTKSNTEPFTPNGDYQPATKKYVDDKSKEINILNETFTGLIGKLISVENNITFNYTLTDDEYNYIKSCIGKKNILTSDEIYHLLINVDIYEVSLEGAIVVKYENNSMHSGLYNDVLILSINDNTKEVESFIYNTYGTSINNTEHEVEIKENMINLQKNTSANVVESQEIFNIYKVLNESQYAALGDAVNSDNIIYFVTPDA